MDLQFNEQFVRVKFIPTLKTLLERMGKPADADPKGVYLAKLLIPQDLDAKDRKRFNEEYFLGVQPESRAFTGPGEAKYRERLLDGIAEYLRQQKLLRGESGLKNAFLPDEERGFETSAEMNRNLLNMAYRLISRFEKQEIAELEGEMSDEDEEKLESGNLKLVNIGGKDRVIDSTQLEAMEPGAVMTPYIQPAMPVFTAPAGGGAAMPAAPAAVAVLETVSGEQKAVTVTADEFASSFRESRMEGAAELLEKAGLEIVQLTAEKEMIKGVVRDVSGQLLEVEINALSVASDPRKIKFTFQDPVRDKTDNGAYRGRFFYLSANDLAGRFLVNGQRVPAEDVYASLPPEARFKGYQLPPDTLLPGEEKIPELTATPLARPEAPAAGAGAPATAEGGAVPGFIPEDTLVREAPGLLAGASAGRKRARETGTLSSRTRGAQTKTEVEAETQAQGMEEETMTAQSRQMERRAPVQPLRVGGRQKMMERRRAARKKHRRTMALLAGGSAGIAAAAPGTAFLVGLLQSNDSASEGITLILQCIGTACFC